MRATLACLLTSVCIANVLKVPFNNEKRNSKKVNSSKM